jgi:hypothetical protein
MNAVKERPILFSAPMVRSLLDGSKTQTRRLIKLREPFTEYMGTVVAGDPGNFFKNPDTLDYMDLSCPYGEPGDRLWVRETTTYWEQPDRPKDWHTPRSNESSRPKDGARYQRWMSRVMAEAEPGEDFLVYKADEAKRSLSEWKYPHPIYEHCVGRFGKTVTAIHMHRWASRLTLEITDVRVQRLQDISADDAIAEGIKPLNGFCYGPDGCSDCNEKGCKAERDDFQKLWDSINAKRALWDSNPWIWVLTFKRATP